MRVIRAEVKKYERTQSRKKSDGSKGEYKTIQYLITLKKDDVEREDFENVDEVSVTVPDELKELQSSEKKAKDELIQLQRELIEYQNLQLEHDKLQNSYNHTHQVLIKREKELSDAQNEVNYLRNRGIFETMLDKLRKKPAIEPGKEEKN